MNLTTFLGNGFPETIKSQTNFTSEFFFDSDNFNDITKKFNNPGYKIASGPIEVEFMLQEG